MFTSIVAVLGPVLQPILTEVLNAVLIPEVSKLEAEIGSPALKAVIVALTSAVEGLAPGAIAKL